MCDLTYVKLSKWNFAIFNPLSANSTKWSNTLKQFVGKLPTNCLSVFDHFVELALKGLKRLYFSRAVFLFEIQKNQIIQNNQ